MSKGSWQRPRQVDRKTYEKNWDNIFKKYKIEEAYKKAVQLSEKYRNRPWFHSTTTTYKDGGFVPELRVTKLADCPVKPNNRLVIVERDRAVPLKTT